MFAATKKRCIKVSLIHSNTNFFLNANNGNAHIIFLMDEKMNETKEVKECGLIEANMRCGENRKDPSCINISIIIHALSLVLLFLNSPLSVLFKKKKKTK